MVQTYFNWSGGKDSALSLYKIKASNKYSVTKLLTTVNSSEDQVVMSGVPIELLMDQAEALGIPLQIVDVSKEQTPERYELIMGEIVKQLQNEGCTHAVFGDIFLEQSRQFRQERLGRLGLKGVYPLWQKSSLELMKEFIELGFKAIVVCVSEKHLDESFCGRIIDNSFLADLPENVDPCGENGEFHSFVFDGPVFTRPVPVFKAGMTYKRYANMAPVKDDPFVQTDLDKYGYYYCRLGKLVIKTRAGQSPTRFSIKRGATKKMLFEQLDNVRKKIDANPESPWSIQTLSALSHMSPYHFSKAFRLTYGIPPSKYIANRRIEKATKLLQLNSYSFTYIAKQCGYSNVYMFSRSFKLLTGMAPSKYMQEVTVRKSRK